MGVGVADIDIHCGRVKTAAAVRGADSQQEALLLLIVQRLCNGYHALCTLRCDAESVTRIAASDLIMHACILIPIKSEHIEHGRSRGILF